MLFKEKGLRRLSEERTSEQKPKWSRYVQKNPERIIQAEGTVCVKLLKWKVTAGFEEKQESQHRWHGGNPQEDGIKWAGQHLGLYSRFHRKLLGCWETREWYYYPGSYMKNRLEGYESRGMERNSKAVVMIWDECGARGRGKILYWECVCRSYRMGWLGVWQREN